MTLRTHGQTSPCRAVPSMAALRRGCMALVCAGSPTQARLSPQGSQSCSQQALLMKSGEQRRTQHLMQAGWMCSDLSVEGLGSSGCSHLWLPFGEKSVRIEAHRAPKRRCPELTCRWLGVKRPLLQVKPLVCLLPFREAFSGGHCHLFSVVGRAVQPCGTVWVQRWKVLANRRVSESRTCCERPGQD